MSGYDTGVGVMTKVLLLAVALLLASTAASQAGFRVCNKSSVRMDVSIGYKDANYGWTSEGWWRIDSGDCQSIINGNLSNRYYYVYAAADDREWTGDKGQDGGYFCISARKYTIHSDDYLSGDNLNCSEGGFKGVKFIEIDTGNSVDFTENLLE
jgi:uncharacterized membrane protein